MCNFFRDPARYYATQCHNPRSDLYKTGFKSSTRLAEKKVKKFQCDKKSTSGDITKNVGGASGKLLDYYEYYLKVCISYNQVVENRCVIKFDVFFYCGSAYTAKILFHQSPNRYTSL